MKDENITQEKKVTVSPIEIAEISAGAGTTKEASKDVSFLKEVPLTISVELGRIQMNIEEVLQLGQGSMVMLKKQINEPLDLLINGKMVGHGEIVAVDDYFGIRITEIIDTTAGNKDREGK